MIPTRIQQVVPGGMFVGLIRTSSNVFAIFASPVWAESVVCLKNTDTLTDYAVSSYNGKENTQVMSDIDHPAAALCRSTHIGEFDDFYLPSIAETDLLYRVLGKPEWYPFANPFAVPTVNRHDLELRALNQEFKVECPESYYWSSTFDPEVPGAVFARYFVCGSDETEMATRHNRVRPVRQQLVV